MVATISNTNHFSANTMSFDYFITEMCETVIIDRVKMQFNLVNN